MSSTMLINPGIQRLAISMRVVKLFVSAMAAWVLGIALIAAILFFKNGGVDFTVTDFSGFAVMAILWSGLLMLVLYLPSLYWLKRRRHGVKPRVDFLLLTGVFCNLPVYILCLTLTNRTMVLSETIGFIATFLVIGAVFGLGFTLAYHPLKQGLKN